MSDQHNPYTALTEDELAELARDSEQLPGEDSSTWAARSQALSAAARDRAARRLATETTPLEDEAE